MSVLQVLNTIATVLYYVIDAFFLFAIVKTFIKTKDIQDAILYALIMMPFRIGIVVLFETAFETVFNAFARIC